MCSPKAERIGVNGWDLGMNGNAGRVETLPRFDAPTLHVPNPHAPLDTPRCLRDKTDVFARAGRLLLILALLGATGAHWAVLQSVAWANMLAENARVECLPVALAKTFDGRHPCALCKQIAEGRRSEQKSDVRVESKRLEFVTDAVVLVVESPRQYHLIPVYPASAPRLAETPPVPPPRPVSA